MSEWITGRNPIYEVLRAKRRHLNRLLIAENAQVSGRLAEIIRLARSQRIPIEQVKRPNLDGIDPHHQGIALSVGAYPYTDLEAIIRTAETRQEAVFVLLLDQVQ
ncbi:MAG: RNA methyltransferase substrate-binding domain-containing protein, partial [Brevefilum sp.]